MIVRGTSRQNLKNEFRFAGRIHIRLNESLTVGSILTNRRWAKKQLF